MNSADDTRLTRDDAAVILAAQYIWLQQQLEDSGQLPRRETRSQRFATRILGLLGAAALGILVACLVLFAEFVVFNLIFHFEF